MTDSLKVLSDVNVFTCDRVEDTDWKISRRRKRIQLSLLAWAEINLRSYPWRVKSSPYDILIAEVLLKRTTAKAASKVYENFLLAYPNIMELSRAKSEDLECVLKPIGYSKTRSKELKAISEHIVTKCGGSIPSRLDELDSIPFIGPYTAGAIMCFSYNCPAPMVDSNVERIIERILLYSFKRKPSNREVARLISFILPGARFKEFNLALLDLGGLICTPKNPKCKICPLADICDYFLVSRTKT